MQYHVLSHLRMPCELRINGLSCTCKQASLHNVKTGKEADGGLWNYTYVCYGTRPRVEELRDYGPWLMRTEPFFVEVEKPVLSRWIKRGEPLPKEKGTVQSKENGEAPAMERDEVLPIEIEVEGRPLRRVFDRYYFGDDLTEEKLRFVFDYMAPTYEADIDYDMNLDVNSRLLAKIAESVEDRPMRIIDYGVGTGICAAAMPDVEGYKYTDWEIVGLDISKQMVRKARERCRSEEDRESILVEAHEIRGNRAPYVDDGSFHAAIACFTVHYFLDSRPYREIYRLLEDGGLFVCNVPENRIQWFETRASEVGFIPQEDRRERLEHKVRTQHVFLLAFVKRSDLSRIGSQTPNLEGL